MLNMQLLVLACNKSQPIYTGGEEQDLLWKYQDSVVFRIALVAGRINKVRPEERAVGFTRWKPYSPNCDSAFHQLPFDFSLLNNHRFAATSPSLSWILPGLIWFLGTWITTTALSLFPNGQATQDHQGHKWAAMVIKAHYWNNIFTMDLDLTFNILPISPYLQQKKTWFIQYAQDLPLNEKLWSLIMLASRLNCLQLWNSNVPRFVLNSPQRDHVSVDLQLLKIGNKKCISLQCSVRNCT